MEVATSIPVRKAIRSRIHEVDFGNLEFGRYVSDHMLVCDFFDKAWTQPHVTPFANLSLSPTSLALHYGQTVFEGMKAFRMQDGRINIFRIGRHYERFVRSLERMCMAVPPKSLFFESIITLVEADRDWVPPRPGDALYIRPFVYASEARFGVKVSNEYRFVIFTGPVPELYSEPIRVKVETRYVRAARGGTGFAKCGGNYGGAFLPSAQAKNEGYDQVLWTDAEQNKYIEESGMMNAMFVIGGVLITPPVSDTILDGVTRDSLLAIARDLGIPVEERRISIDELELAFRRYEVTEAFGVGTAAVVAPIQTIHITGIDYSIPTYGPDAVWRRMKQRLFDIRTGQEEDVHGWNYVV
ncbi:MAG TPA: branched-chain amino acid aminotransferase [Chitinophagaceae bacterium]|nr:branched-chain amino acid aminotransferase [Chitinophagaceae bacterium]